MSDLSHVANSASEEPAASLLRLLNNPVGFLLMHEVDPNNYSGRFCPMPARDVRL
jgi:hypothetical protein